jgi:ammonia channel protein AmtB
MVLFAVVFDRVNPSALCIFISLWHIVVYAPLAHMVWHPTGLIRQFGVLDFAGECSRIVAKISEVLLKYLFHYSTNSDYII